MSVFGDEALEAIGAWQNGWREDQARREVLATTLTRVVAGLPEEFRSVSSECYRKRFIHKGELTDIILLDEKHEGVASWTTEKDYAERFKGLVRNDAITAAIFAHCPEPHEVVVNIAALWGSPEFIEAAESYRRRSAPFADALFNFNSRQGEVVLRVPLRGSEIKWLVGMSSPFDALCDEVGLPEEGRDDLFCRMLASGAKISEPRYTPEGGAQRALKNTIDEFNSRWARLQADGALERPKK